MPIYGYKCSVCGFQKDVLQKIGEPPLTQCPQCRAQTFSKLLSAPGFQLKGSGWYATDFKGKPQAVPNEATSKNNDSTTVPATPSAGPADAKTPAEAK